jgi:hypothetical protein
MKSKFKNLNFESVEVLSREEKSKVVGGAYGNSSGGENCGTFTTTNGVTAYIACPGSYVAPVYPFYIVPSGGGAYH